MLIALQVPLSQVAQPKKEPHASPTMQLPVVKSHTDAWHGLLGGGHVFGVPSVQKLKTPATVVQCPGE
jgi:hypothetical protein